MKRAIALAGGGPAAGLHIGALEKFDKAGIKFDVWALSCIGAWVGIVYNQCDPGKEVEQTRQFFHDYVFRDDVSYSRFPINSVFGADSAAITRALAAFVLDPNSYRNLWLPSHLMAAAQDTLAFLRDPSRWNEGDFNRWTLNSVLSVNPFVRYWTSVMYLSRINGLSRICYPDSNFMRSIKFERLFEKDKPFIFHNAWNINKGRLALFSNKPSFKPEDYKRITPTSLCACSALPYVEETVDIDGETYCEGALIDTVNFKRLIKDHDLDEIWVSRIVSEKQVRPPNTLADALANLCMLFAATVGEDDIKLFRFHAEKEKWPGRLIEIEVADQINFEWTHSNLEYGRKLGYHATERAIEKYKLDQSAPTTKKKMNYRAVASKLSEQPSGAL